MNPNIQIYEATLNDAADIARVHVKSWQQTYVGQLPQNYLDALDVERRQNMWEEALKTKPSTYPNLFIARDTGNIVGFISLGQGRDKDKYNLGEIHAVYILKEAWGHGIGYNLYRTARETLRSAGYEKAYTWVLDTNQNAIKAYKRWGGVVDPSQFKNLDLSGQSVKEIAVLFEVN